jgi:Holliday junction resolvase RusA-like endonuclease
MIKIIDIEGIKIASINQKYGYNRTLGRAFISKEYSQFKKLVIMSCKKLRLDGPYRLQIEFGGYIDIDAPIKCIMDGIETAGVIYNDREVYELKVIKYPQKKGADNWLIVHIDTIKIEEVI